MRKILTNYVFIPILKYFGIDSTKPGLEVKEKVELQRTIRRVSENLWFSLYFALLTFFGLYTYYKQRWSFDFSSWSGYITQRELWADRYNHDIDVYLKNYFALQLGYYVSAVYYLFAEDERRKDFFALIYHHVITIALIVMAIMYHLNRTGLLTNLFHDLPDTFLYLAKSAVYVKLKRFADVLFAMFAILYFICRLVIFPAIVYAYSINPINVENSTVCIYELGVIGYVGLLVLDIFWFNSILVVIKNSIIDKKELRDNREEE